MSKSSPHFIRQRKSPHGAAASAAGQQRTLGHKSPPSCCPPDFPSRSVYFPRENVTNPSRFGIFTFGSVCASIVSFSPMMPLRCRI